MLERGKKHAMACLALILLLSKVDLWTDKRGHWFTRLAINLKHIKLKREAFIVCELALDKQGPVASKWIRAHERNGLLKLRLTLF